DSRIGASPLGGKLLAEVGDFALKTCGVQPQLFGGGSGTTARNRKVAVNRRHTMCRRRRGKIQLCQMIERHIEVLIRVPDETGCPLRLEAFDVCQCTLKAGRNAVDRTGMDQERVECRQSPADVREDTAQALESFADFGIIAVSGQT